MKYSPILFNCNQHLYNMYDQLTTIIFGSIGLALFGGAIWLLLQAIAWIGDLFQRRNK